MPASSRVVEDFKPDQLDQAIAASTESGVDIVVIREMMGFREAASLARFGDLSVSDVATFVIATLEDPEIIPGAHGHRNDYQTEEDLLGTEDAPFGAIDFVSVGKKNGPQRTHIDMPQLVMSTSTTLNQAASFRAERIAPYGSHLADIYSAFDDFGDRRPRSLTTVNVGDLAIVSSGIIHRVAAKDTRKTLLAATCTTWYPGAAEHLQGQIVAPYAKAS